MKLSVGDRILAAIYVLLTLALCAAVGLRSLGMDLIGDFYDLVVRATPYWYLIFYGVLAIVVLLGLYMLRLAFRRRPKGSPFVTIDAGDNGKVIVAMSALEQMVRQAANGAQGVSDMKIGVRGEDDSISVGVELTVLGGVHLPTVTMNLQREIRRYVELNCGVAVRDVTVTVGAVISPEEAAQAAAKPTGRKRSRRKDQTAVQPAVVYQPEPVAEAPSAQPAEESCSLEPAEEPAVEPAMSVSAEEFDELVAVVEEAAGYAFEEPADEESIPETDADEPEQPAEADAPVEEIPAEEEQPAEEA